MNTKIGMGWAEKIKKTNLFVVIFELQLFFSRKKKFTALIKNAYGVVAGSLLL